MPPEQSGLPDPQPPSLPSYKYEALKDHESLRLIRLRPASDEQVDIDCEIVEVRLPETGSTGEAPNNVLPQSGTTSQSNNSGSNPRVNGVGGTLARLDEVDSSDDEGFEDAPQDEPVIIPDVAVDDQSYEAVSWCWGKEPTDIVLRVHSGDTVSAFNISKNLRTALWALRRHDAVRQLWIDAICINQKNTIERNLQVPRMDKIYGRAKNVCIWLGEGTDDSKLAMDFIKQKVLELWRFDELIENRRMAKHWAALIRLMKRPWFSRRWVVQEIALSPRGGILYCGKESSTWQDFADAVSLFVEVESATHRLSDVMKLDQTFGNIPDFFGDVSSLGAALLVDATSNLFRNAMTGERKPLSSLEFLVSRLSVFEATQPRDTIYALLAISKDTLPQSLSNDSRPDSQPAKNAMNLAPSKGFSVQPYNVDYTLPVIDVFQEFIRFSIQKAEPTSALDIICRPWAPTVLESHDRSDFLKEPSETLETWKIGRTKEDSEIPLPSWYEVWLLGPLIPNRDTNCLSRIPSLSGAAFEMEEHPTAGLRMERQNADPLVGMPESGHGNYSAAGTRKLDLKKLRFVKWKSLRKTGASYPEYSMFVPGFILDEVLRVEQLAANGNIPYRWLRAAGWTDVGDNPPEEFWRTLVADRGHGGRNPPTYFPRACKESMRFKAKTMSKTSGNLDSKKMINEGRCTIVAEFLRRVQAVIWNRQLMRTKEARLGLVRDDVKAGFKVCILYGCSVPVILEEIAKTPAEIKAEQHDVYQKWKKELKRLVAYCQARFMMKKLREAKEKDHEEAQKMVEVEPDRNNLLPETPAELQDVAQGVGAESTIALLSDDIGIGPKHESDTEAGTSAETEETPNKISLAEEPGSGASPEAEINPTAVGAPGEKPATPQPHNAAPANGEQSPDKKLAMEKAQQDERGGTRKPIARRKTVLEEHSEGEKLYRDRKKGEKKRPLAQEAYYRLVGECYVHGMMNGEAIGFQNREQISEQVFELR